MRVISGLGAALFLYLALIPAGLIYSTLDSACSAAACETSVLSRVLFTALYAVCLAALLVTAALFADHAARGTPAAQQRLPRALAVTGSIAGIAVFALFLVAFPVPASVALAIAGAGYGLVRLSQSRQPPAPPDPATNGHSSNGHRALPSLRRPPRAP